MTLFELQAILKMDSSDFDKGIDSASKKANGLGGKLSSGLGKVAKVAVGAVTASATAVTAIGASSVKAGMDFDKAMSQVYATMGENAEKMVEYNGQAMKSSDALRSFAKKMGAETAFSATESAEALNYMALAGYDAETSIAMLPNVLNLASAGTMDLAQASDMVTDAQTALGLSIEETNTMVDQMAKTSSTTNTSVKQLGEAMLTIGGTARFMKGGTNELNQVLGILADNGIKGSEAGTHLRNMLLKLSDPTDAGASAMAKLGLEIYDAEGNMRSFQDIFGDMKKSMKDLGYTSEEMVTAFADMFNVRDVASAQALLNTDEERWNEVAEAIENAGFSLTSFGEKVQKNLGTSLDDIRSKFSDMGVSSEEFDTALKNANGDAQQFMQAMLASTQQGTSYNDILSAMGGSLDNLQTAFDETTGSAQAMADTQLDNLAGDLTIFNSALEGAKIAISDNLTPTLREFVQFGTGGLSDLTKAIDEGGLTGAFGMLGDFLSQGLTMIVDQLPAVMDAGMELVSSLGQGILDNLPKLTQIAVDMAVKIAEGLVTALPQLMEAGVQVITTIINGISENLPTLLPLMFDAVGELLQGLIDALPLLAEGAIQLITSLSQYVIENLPTLIETGLQMLMTLSESLRTNIGLIIDAGIQLLLGLAQGLIEALPAMIDTIPTIIDNIVNIINDNMPKLIVAGVKIIVALAVGLVKAIPTLIKNIPKIIKTIFDVFMAVNWLKLGGDIIKGIANGIKNLFGHIRNTAKDLVKNITDGGGLKNLPKMALEWGKDMIMNFINGIKNKIANLVNTVKGVAKKIKDLIGFSEPKEGPLSNFHTYAPDMMNLFMQGIKDNEDALQAQVASTFDFGEVGTISAPKIGKLKAGGTDGGLIDYEALGNAVANSLNKSNMGIKIGEREFGRVVRSAVSYG